VPGVAAARVALDEDVRPLLARLLRDRGPDAISVHDARRLGLSDADQLAWATAEQRVFVTHNSRDLARLASEWASALPPSASARAVLRFGSSTGCKRRTAWPRPEPTKPPCAACRAERRLGLARVASQALFGWRAARALQGEAAAGQKAVIVLDQARERPQARGTDLEQPRHPDSLDAELPSAAATNIALRKIAGEPSPRAAR